MELEHPMILPLKGFSCADLSFQTINIYRESSQNLIPIDDNSLEMAIDERKIRWIKQIIDLTHYINEETCFKINLSKFEKCAVLDQNDDLIFVNMKFLKYCDEDEDAKNSNMDSFWRFIIDIDTDLSTLNIPCKIRNILTKYHDDSDYDEFMILKLFFDNYNQNVNYNEIEVMKYLEDYHVEKEIKGHQCYVTIYKRNILSNKKFKRLVLKKYDFVFSSELKKLQRKASDWEKNIIEIWTTKTESFMIMNFIKARRLKDLIPSLDYDQKIQILKKIVKICDYNYQYYNLSVNNVYLNKNFKVKLIDCIFYTDNSDDPYLAPEVITGNLSTIQYHEKEKIYINSIGVIAYEIFGKTFSPEVEFNFDGIPLFIKYFILVCSNKKPIERPSIEAVSKRLENYQEHDPEKIFHLDLIELSPYFIDPNDLIKAKIGKANDHFVQKSTKKYLIKSETDYLSIEAVRASIQISICKYCLPIYGFSYRYNYNCYYEYIRDWIRFDEIGMEEYSEKEKIDVLKTVSYAYSEIFDMGFLIHLYNTNIAFDLDNQIKLAPKLKLEYDDSDIDEEIKGFADKMIDLFNGNWYDEYINPETPNIIQALLWRILVGEKEERATFSQIAKVFKGMDNTLTTEADIDWSEERGSFENGEFIVYTSHKNSDLVEEGIRVDILMECSNLSSYVKKGNDFALIYRGKCDSQFPNKLHVLESSTIRSIRMKEKLKDLKIDHEYKGKHCLVQYLTNGEEEYVLKKYLKTYDETDVSILMTSHNEIYGIDSTILLENNQLTILQRYEKVETLEDCLNRGVDFINDKYKKELILEMIRNSFTDYLRFSPHNICIELDYERIYIVDNINLTSNNYEDFKDEFVAPECEKLQELDEDEKKSALIYSIGWTSFVMFGLTPQVDSETQRFKSPIFPDNFPQFWKDFITLTTRENSIDRPERKYLTAKIENNSPFDETDFILVSSKLLNHSDYVIEDPVGAGGESIIFMVTNKLTGEKHACKSLKYKIRSIEVKKILRSIENLNSSIFGIKYIGVSVSDGKVFLHMEYVPNGTLSDVITLDRRMQPPSWFTETAKLRICKEVSYGMKSLHEQGIIHGDLKPENILLDSNNCVKICDFSFIPEEGAATPLFMAPELFNGEESTEKSDVYAFAVTLCCLYGGGDMIGSVKTAATGGFRPSIAAGTPSSIQTIIMKCWQQNPDDRPTFSEIIDELELTDSSDFDLRIESMEEFGNFDPNKKRGVLNENYEYEICDITGDIEYVEHLIRLHMTIQPDSILHIHRYCRLGDKIILIIELVERTTFSSYLSEKKKVSSARGEKFISDFISLFELYHKNRFFFGNFSLDRLFFKDKHRSSICFDLFEIPGLVRPQRENETDEATFSPPEGFNSREGDVFAFACFVQKIFNCLEFDSDGNISTKPFKRSRRAKVQPIPFKYQNIIMERCLSKEPMTRPTFELIFQKLFPVQYKIISTFLSVSVSRFSTFSMKDFGQEEIVILETLGSGTFGKVVHAISKTKNMDMAVKEFNDSTGERNEDFMLEFVALKAIDHPNIVKIIGACQRKESIHGSRLFMEFAGRGDLENNMNEPFDDFIVHLLQISSAMKYLHQRGIIHFDLKPKNILIRGDGSAAVADFNTAMHVDIDTHLRSQRGSVSYMSPEIRNCEKYSFSTDVFSFGVLACEYFSSDSHKIIKEANEKHERPVLDFIPDKRLRSLLEFCVDDDPMSRPSFDFICNFLFKKFIKNTSMEAKLEELTRIPRIDEDKLNQIRVLASRGSCEAIIEYGKYLLRENKFDDAMHVFLLGANEGDTYCQNTFGVLSKKKYYHKPNNQ